MSRRLLIAIFGLLAFAGLVLGATFSTYSGQWFRGFSGIPGIEDRLADDARDLLEGSGVSGALVAADGRDLTVETSSQLPGSLQNELEAIDGVGSITYRGASVGSGDTGDADVDAAAGDANSTTDSTSADEADASTDATEPADKADSDGADGEPAPADTTKLDVTYDGQSVVIEGTVQNIAARDTITRAAARLAGDDQLVDEIEIVGGDGSDLDAVTTVASIVTRLGEWYDEATVRLDGNEIRVDGTATAGGDIDAATEIIGQLAVRAGLTTVVESTPAPEPDSTVASEGDSSDSAAVDPAAIAAVNEVLATVNFGAIDFEPGTSILTEDAVATLNDAAGLLAELPAVPITIVGHSDGIGDPDVNLLLSDDRALTVREYLIGRGVPADRLDAVGVGDSQPIADSSNDEGRAANERIEFVVAEGNN